MSLNTYYDAAMNYKEYIQLLGENLALHQLHYKKFIISDDKLAELKSLNASRILVITEPWCGDSLALLPVIWKMSEAKSDWEIKIILRDKHPDLIDQFLTNNVRAIPVFLFLDNSGELILKWGPRPEKAQEIFEMHRDLIATGQLEKTEVIKKIRTFYAKNRGEAVYQDLMHSMEKKV